MTVAANKLPLRMAAKEVSRLFAHTAQCLFLDVWVVEPPQEKGGTPLGHCGQAKANNNRERCYAQKWVEEFRGELQITDVEVRPEPVDQDQ